MIVIKKYKKSILLFLFFIYFKYINNTESIFSYGMKYAKIFKLNNGNIVVVGDLGIHIYDNTGINSLFNRTITQNKITSPSTGAFTNMAQFSNENNGLVIVLANHILYILNSEGKYQFEHNIKDDISQLSNTQFYTIVPYIYKDNYYHFILGYINNNKKAFLQYYLINVPNEQIIPEGYYEFDENDPERLSVGYDKGITCQFMNHFSYKIVLTCFYQNNEPQEISSISFKLKNNNFEKIENFNDSYSDFSFCLQSDVTSDRKNSLLCYIKNMENKGYCVVYNIDNNKFEKYKNYISNQCGTDIYRISVDYYKETKEFIFSCTQSNADIYLAKFDQNLDLININSQAEATLSISHCYASYFYSILFMQNDYIVLGDFKCDDEIQITTLYSIPNEYKPKEIYSDIIEISLNDDNEEDDLTTESLTNETECKGYKNSEGTICSENIPNGYYLIDFFNKLLGKCHINCQSCEEGPEENNNNCLTCKDNFEFNNNNCLYKYNYYFDKKIQEIIYLLADELCPEKFPYEIVETKECVESCTNNDLINKKCKVNSFSDNNINLITNKLKSIINEVTDSDYDVIVDGNNIIYEITSTSSNNDHQNISKIDFGECENILKKEYSINYLLVFKMDVKLNDSYPTKVEYEVYSPKTKEKLDLTLCENSQIDVYVPINLDNYTNNLYNLMSKNGFDILNKEDSFYNDICTPFTSDDGTDITLNDRQNTYYNENIALCENNCVYSFYNNSNGKIKCECPIKNEISEIKTISFDKIDINTFLDIKSLSNIELIKCFILTFSKIGQNKNYGSIILICMTIIFVSLIILYFLRQKTSISRILRLALKSNGFESPPKRKSISIHYSSKDNEAYNISNNQTKGQAQTIRNLIDINQSIKDNNSNNNEINIKRRKSQKFNLQIKNFNITNIIKKENENIITDKNLFKEENHQEHKSNKNNRHENINTQNIKKIDSRKSSVSLYQIKEKNKNRIKTKESYKNLINEIKYNDYELNNMTYKEAISNDKRTYLLYYISLINTKHIILLIFMPSNDYNLILIKIGLFIFSFSLYFTVNALFFTDKTMHKIYESKGLLNILNQLPQIIYSTIISSFINILIKQLALSGKDICNLKKIKDREKALKKSLHLYKILMIKFNLFFFVSLLLLIFFWYYLSAFCAVYKNTQINLITNTLTSFGFTLIYPFVLYLLPGLFRIPALKSSKHDKEYLYTIGNIIALI